MEHSMVEQPGKILVSPHDNEILRFGIVPRWNSDFVPKVMKKLVIADETDCHSP